MTASLTSWDLNVPGDTLTIGNIPDAIRNAKEEITTRVEKEHSVFSTATDKGGVHKLGSARAFLTTTTEPALQPDGTTALGGSTDKGRLWVDDDTDILHYFTSGGVWAPTSVADGSVEGFVSRNGRSGGQYVTGGTGGGDDLNFRAAWLDAGDDSVNDITPGDFIFTEATNINFSDIPIENLTLEAGTNFDANSSVLQNLLDPVADGDALSKGSASITAAELSASGGVVNSCWGTATGAGANLSADVGFDPDLVIVGNTTNGETMHLWTNSLDTLSKTKKFKDGSTVVQACELTSTNTLTFYDNVTGGNDSGEKFFYFAFKFNKQVTPS